MLAAVAQPESADAARRRGAPPLDPVGTWNCVVYGHPAFGDERMLMHFARNGAALVARQSDDRVLPWTGLVGWTAEDDELVFSDPQTGRQFAADLQRETLGGSWRTMTLLGGWWCGRTDTAEAPSADLRAPPQRLMPLMPPLVPSLTATPAYPIQAIREAKQGRAVTCFFVDADGRVVQPELIELSDEIFREPILAALERSRFQTLADEDVLRPGCRSYTFRLDALEPQLPALNR